jgi:hypothetical protein
VGIVGQQVIATGQRFLRRDDLAIGSSLILFLRSLTTVLCLSAFGTAMAFAAALAPGDGVLAGVRVVFFACLVGGVIGLVAVALLPSAARDPRSPDDDGDGHGDDEADDEARNTPNTSRDAAETAV